MSMFRSTRKVAAPLGALILTCAIAGVVGASDEGPVQNRSKRLSDVYIVRMSEDPVVAYRGGIPGLKATKPARGQKIDPNSPRVVDYVRHLNARHDTALAAAGPARKLYDYAYTFNGFAAQLSEAQAAKVATVPGVLSVSRDQEYFADTSSTPAFLGLNATGGLWEQLGGVDSAGEDIIIGIVDSGVWPEHPSFSDRTGSNGNGSQAGKLGYQQIPGWHGKCSPGEAFTASDCNHKLIGAQRFNEGWGGDAGIEADRPWEFTSPRDYHGHGTHTASTAGGNSGVPATGDAAVFGNVSGIAPRARIAMYKALWSTETASTASGTGVDLVAAIDQAVADGVDVINYSISGTTTNFLDAVQIAFLNAADVGVFVACSAGNSGPTTGTVAHPGPWLTTVAAGTHNRNGEGSVVIDGHTYTGASLANAITGTLVDAENSGLTGSDPLAARQCFAAADNLVAGVPTPVLDPAKVAGKIVLCDRGVNALVNKSLAVKQAGGIGMVLTNVAGGGTNTLALMHSVPAVHLAYSATDYAALHAAADEGEQAAIAQATIIFNVAAPLTASFSSRGPLTAGGGDLLKPDVIAPGQDILAGVAPPGNNGLLFSLYSGTSMSSPHVAGLAALLKNRHPSWSPMMIKSALMTSAYDILDGPNTNPLVIFRQGAGHVRPNSAADPGLVFDANINDWLAFLCGTTTGVTPATCSALVGLGYSLDPSNLNVASIAIGDMAGVQKVTRRVTNVSDAAATYTPSYTGLLGFTVAVSPASLTLNPGQTKSFTVTFTRTTATLNVYTGGQITWSDGTHSVRIPAVIRPVALAAPASVFGNGSPISYNVTFGYTGPFTAEARGLVPATTNAGTVADDPADSFVRGGPGTLGYEIVIPAGTSHARFSLFDAFTDGADDLDLYVYSGTGTTGGTLVGSSGGGTSAEEVNLRNPAAGTYTVWVHGWGTDGPDADFTLFNWVLGTTAAGNMTVSAPASAMLGVTGPINLSFSGLTAGTKYLGSVAYAGAAGMPNPTIVRVDTP
jgi:subtilisin family serine protease